MFLSLLACLLRCSLEVLVVTQTIELDIVVVSKLTALEAPTIVEAVGTHTPPIRVLAGKELGVRLNTLTQGTV